MIRKLLILTFLFFVPVTYLPYLLQGYILQAGFINILIISIIFAACVVIAPLITDFLTLRRNIFTKIAFVTILMYGAIYALSTFTHLLQITIGGLNPSFFSQIAFLKNLSVTLDPKVNTAVTSLLMAIWGIIWNLLIS